MSSWLKIFYNALTRKERLTLFGAALGVLIGILGIGFIYLAHNTVSVAASGGSYREGIVGQPSFINPVVAKSSVDKSLTRLLFASAQDLSKSIEVSSDNKLIKLHLQEGLRWSDGEEITADDVVFTVSAIQNPDTASPLAPAWQGVKAIRTSKLEVDFLLPTAYVFFEDNLKTLRPIPKHLFAEIPPANWKLSDYNLKPVVSGPYIFATRTVDPDGFVEWYRLRANHFAKSVSLIDTLDLVFERTQENLVKDFNTGTIDGFFLSDPSGINGVNRPYQETKFASPTYYAVFWNQTANVALGENAVRKALATAIDRLALTQNVLGNYGQVSTDPFSPALLPPLSNTTSSIEVAKAILDENGWKPDSTGLRIKKAKKSDISLQFTLTVPDVPLLTKTANFLKTQWEQIGAKVTVTTAPIQDLLDGPIKNRSYEALLFGNTLTHSGDLYSFWHSSERLYPGLNLALYKNNKADQLINSIRGDQSSEARSLKMDELRQVIVTDDPALFLYSPVSVYVTAKGVRGVEGGAITDPSDRFSSVTSWYTTTKRVWK
jgi:peptide/nickel transport system substrate-binding protein